MSVIALDAKQWPELPYRGLNYYRPADRPLLAGRDRDVAICSTKLAHSETRVLLLHGMTGSGKSSFLRAGLIPTMQQEGAGYLFMHTVDGQDEAIFIRCTDAPIDQIARQIYEFSRRPFVLQTPNGRQAIDLAAALLEKRSWADYLNEARNEGGLVESLQQLAMRLSKTLVLIIDQAEEVLTMTEGEEGFANRAAFFRFLREFQNIGFDARIIVALRTEFYGRFIDAVRIGDKANEFKQFLLNDLERPALIEAIVRPTRRDPIGPYPAPYDTYGFEYEDGLPEEIADRILAARHTGAALPVLQLVCLGLYNSVVRTNQAQIINAGHFNEARGVEGQIMGHLSKAVSALHGAAGEADREVRRVRAALKSFYVIQDDGTVVSSKRETKAAVKLFAEKRVSEPMAIIEKLADPEVLVLRKIRTVQPDGTVADEYTLGHDWIALALERWEHLEVDKNSLRSRRSTALAKVYSVVFALLILIAIGQYVLSEYTTKDSSISSSPWINIIIILGVTQVIMSFMLTSESNNFLVRTLDKWFSIIDERADRMWRGK